MLARFRTACWKGWAVEFHTRWFGMAMQVDAMHLAGHGRMVEYHGSTLQGDAERCRVLSKARYFFERRCLEFYCTCDFWQKQHSSLSLFSLWTTIKWSAGLPMATRHGISLSLEYYCTCDFWQKQHISLSLSSLWITIKWSAGLPMADHEPAGHQIWSTVV